MATYANNSVRFGEYNHPIINNPTIGKPAFLIVVIFTFNSKKKIDIGATYLKIISYNSILLDAEGIKLKFAITAVNSITRSAGPPSCFPVLVFPA